MRTQGLIVAALAVLALGADMGVRTGFDLNSPAGMKWEVGDGMKLQIDGGVLALSCPNANFGWAAPAAESRWAVTPGLEIRMTASAVDKGQLKMQAEWFDAGGAGGAGGKFLGHSDLLTAEQFKPGPCTLTLPESKPAEARAMRVKIWLEGRDASVRITQFTVVAPRQWKKPNIAVTQAWTGQSKLESTGDLKTASGAEGWTLTLPEGKAYDGAVFADRADFSPKAVVQLDLARLTGGSVSLQLVCFDKDGKYLVCVDLFKDLTKPGVYEIPVSLDRSSFPAETAKVSPKVWLGGGNGHSASLAGIWLGAPTP
ncbi:MAG: hypothetical protein IT440_05030 [Phycisphaeraceae bacterium]|nr:hypothetical protein [Phycisphaeraceae bacterium]